MKLLPFSLVGLLLLSFQAPVVNAGPVYVPPNVRGVPDRLVGGASRSNATEAPKLAVLAPREPGWTSSAQPVLYWYVSHDLAVPVTVTITDMATLLDGKPPLLDVRFETLKAGIHALDLGEHQVTLQSDIDYEYSIAFSWPPQTANSSAATSNEHTVVMSRATLLLKPAPAELSQQTAAATPDQLPELYAQAGFWYDSLAALGSLIAQHPDQPDYQNWRAELLQQEVLDSVVKP